MTRRALWWGVVATLFGVACGEQTPTAQSAAPQDASEATSTPETSPAADKAAGPAGTVQVSDMTAKPSAPAGVGVAGSASTMNTPAVAGGVSGTAATVPSAGAGGTSDASAQAGTNAAPPEAGSDAASMATGNILPPADSVDEDGPFAVAPENLSSGPGRTSGVFRPMQLGENGVKHPIFIWSCGGGSQPSNYVWHMNRIASHGFVVVADDAPLDASGSKIKASMDWIIAENDREGSDFYQKLDTTRIGIGGHSMGSLNTLTASNDPRVKASILVCGGGRGGAGAAMFHSPSLYLGGVGEMGTVNYEGDYEETPAPTVFLIKEDTDHIYCARNNMAPWVGFLRWNLAGEEKYKPDFTDMSGIYCKSPWECRSKNW